MIYRLLMLLMMAAPSAFAQEKADVEDFAETLFLQITDASSDSSPQFVRESEYMLVISQQPISQTAKMAMAREMSDGYLELYEVWAKSLDELRESYVQQGKEGATFEYMNSQLTPKSGSKGIFEVQTDFLFKKGPVQNMVSFYYDVAWIEELHKFVMLGPIEEDF